MRSTIIIIMVFAMSISAQGQWSISGKAGANISSVLTQNTADLIDGVKTPHTGVNLEILGHYRFSNQFSISSGIGYSEKGFGLDRRENINVLGVKVPVGLNITQRVQAINIPLRLNYHIPINGMELYASVGGGYSNNIASSISTTGTLVGDFAVNDFNTKDIVNNDEFYANIGGGLSLRAGPGSIFGEVFYAKSLQNYTSDLFLDLPLKNQNITVGVGYSMPLN